MRLLPLGRADAPVPVVVHVHTCAQKVELAIPVAFELMRGGGAYDGSVEGSMAAQGPDGRSDEELEADHGRHWISREPEDGRA
jgi:hypothetical protein